MVAAGLRRHRDCRRLDVLDVEHAVALAYADLGTDLAITPTAKTVAGFMDRLKERAAPRCAVCGERSERPLSARNLPPIPEVCWSWRQRSSADFCNATSIRTGSRSKCRHSSRS